MIGISIAIIALILALVFMFLRAGRRAGALFALPLISVSAFHVLGWAIGKAFAEPVMPNIISDAAGLAAGLLLCWILARAIDLKRLRYGYFVCCAVFLIAMFYAYVNYLL